MEESNYKNNDGSICESPMNILENDGTHFLCLKCMLLKLSQIGNEEFDKNVGEVDKYREDYWRDIADGLLLQIFYIHTMLFHLIYDTNQGFEYRININNT
jgi:hypothetical protein